MRKVILKIMLGAIIAEVCLVCILILTGNIASIGYRSLASVGTIFLYSIPCLAYSEIYYNKKYKYIAICGASFAGILALISIIEMWSSDFGSIFSSKFNSTLSVIVWALAIVSYILSYISSNKLVNLFKKLNMIVITILSAFIIFFVWMGVLPDGIFARLFYMLIVLCAGLIIGFLILTKIYKNEISRLSSEDENLNTVPQTNQSAPINPQSINTVVNTNVSSNTQPVAPVVNNNEPTNNNNSNNI